MILFNWPKRRPAATKAQEIIALILKLETTPSGFRHKKVAVELHQLCLRNPGTVAALIFDGSGLNEVRKERLLFQYSSDHWGSTRTNDNPMWAIMMRQFVIPLMDDLPEKLQEKIKWYQKKGL